MFVKAAFIVFVCIFCATCQVYKIETNNITLGLYSDYQMTFELKLGTPEQKFKAYLHPVFDNLIVVDEHCGKPLQKCPRYCNEAYYPMYCTDNLCVFSEQTRKSVCELDKNKGYVFNSSKSTTFKPVDGRIWKQKLINVRTLIGTYGHDRLVIESLNDDHLVFNDFEFVTGRALDTRLFPLIVSDEDDGFHLNANVIFGISHGPNSIISRLYENKFISAPLMSIALSKQQLVIGDKDREFCSNNWHYFPTTSQSGWEFEGDVYFSTFGWINNTRIVSSPNSPLITFPSNVFSDLDEKWQFIPNTFDGIVSMFMNCSSDLKIEYYIKGRKFVMNFEDFEFVVPDAFESSNVKLNEKLDVNFNMCFLFTEKTDDKMYTSDATWSLGLPFFLKYCHTYDFSKNMLGLADIIAD